MAKAKSKAQAKGKAGTDGAQQAEATQSTEDMLYQQSMEARIEGLKARMESLRDENGLLKQQATKGEKDTHEFVAYFQNQLETKDQLIAKLSEQMTRTEIDSEKQISAAKETSDALVAKAREELATSKQQLVSRVKVLEDELAVLTEYKHKRDVLNTKLQEAEQRLEEQALQHRLALNDIERQFIEKSAKLQRDVDKRIEGIKVQAREEAQQGLDQDTKKIINDNKRMSEELRFQLTTSDELQQAGRALTEENKRLKRNLALASEKEQEYASRGYYRENELNKAKHKIKQLERALSQTVTDFEQARATADATHAKVVEDLELEVSGLKQLVKLKNKELKNIRQLSQVILDQRTEVEQYFLEALEQVKTEIRKQREEAQRRSEQEYRKQVRLAQRGGSGVQFPSIRGKQQSQASLSSLGNRFPLQPGAKVDLRDLSWEDRERVLRLLFAKINAVENQTTDILKDATASAAFARHQAEDLVPYRPEGAAVSANER